MKQPFCGWKKRLKAGALSYVTGLSLVIFMLLMIPFMLDQYGYKQINMLNNRLQLDDKLASAVNLFELGEYTLPYNEITAIQVFKNETGLDCFVEQWGLFDLVHLYTNQTVFRDTLTLLTSDRLLKRDSLCLYMADNKNYLSVAGNTTLEGKCYLPKFGVTKAYVEGLRFEKDTIVNGNIDTASSVLPALKKTIRQRFATPFEYGESNAAGNLPDSLVNDYTSQTVHYHFTGELTISNQVITGKVILSGEEEITISKEAQLDGCLIAAAHIIVEEGFKGRVQLFARDSIVIRNECKLLYPSVLYVDGKEEVSIDIGEDGFICGTIIATGTEKKNCLLNIGKNTIVEGQVYNYGTTSLKGEIWGELHTNHFTYKSQHSSYKDLILNATISKNMISPDFVGLDLLNDVPTKMSITCIPK